LDQGILLSVLESFEGGQFCHSKSLPFSAFFVNWST
jgi:hypothetical protein